MGFFDLNIPYHDAPSSAKPSTTAARAKLCSKAMELGYTGVAYNRSIRGVMSHSDICSIPFLSLSSLKLSPPLLASIKLHRELLGVPLSSPFRQYRRLTVSVESSAQAAALNSGNPILKTYDLIAAKPLNQKSFDQVCKASEVHIIAIDFSENVPFRLKLPLVKDAIKRGAYFEIAYSGLVADVQSRRQVISNARLLVEWTRGKNLIFTSAASSVNELRGPCDVANLSFLLGLSKERATAALSKNCRSLIDSALRKKLYYKEGIKVEEVPEQSNSKEPSFGDWLQWDPISSGEGDLDLDDMAKIFSACSNVSKTTKAIDFASILDSKASHGLQLKDIVSGTMVGECSAENHKNNLSTSEETNKLPPIGRASEQPGEPNLQTDRSQTPLFNSSPEPLTSGNEDPKAESSFLAENFGVDAAEKDSTDLDLRLASTTADQNELESISNCELTVTLTGDTVTSTTLSNDSAVNVACDADLVAPHNSQSNDVLVETSNRCEGIDVDLSAEEVSNGRVPNNTDGLNGPGLLLASDGGISLKNPCRTDFREREDDAADILISTDRVIVGPHSGNHVPKQEMANTVVGDPVLENSRSGRDRLKSKLKRKAPQQPQPFSFRQKLNPVPHKRKSRTKKQRL